MGNMTTEELFEMMEAQPELYENTADEQILVIENDLRTITIPFGIKNLGVESDDDVNRLHFKMPKQYGEFDLSEFDIRINYMNAKNEGDVYAVDDKQVIEDKIEFSWLVGRNAVAYKGDTQFIVCLKKSDVSGTVTQEFNTTVASLNVLQGLETTEKVVQAHPDIIEQILKKIDGMTQISPEQIQAAIEAYFVENPLTAEDVHARSDTWMPTAQEVGALPANTKIPSKLSEMTADSTHRTVTDEEKQSWTNKSDFSGKYSDLTGTPSIPSKTSQITNDSDFQTGEQVQSAVNTAINQKSHFRFEKVESLPSVGEDNIIYLHPAEQGDSHNIYDEYLFKNGGWERIGGTNIDLSGYALKSEIPTVPNTLPNPNTLTIMVNGVKTVYNGATAKTITIDTTSSSAKTPRIEVTGTELIYRMYPNQLVVFTEPLTSLQYQCTDAISTEVSEYHFLFVSGETPTEVIHDPAVNIGNFTVEANKIYEVSILENNLTWQSWEVQSA